MSTPTDHLLLPAPEQHQVDSESADVKKVDLGAEPVMKFDTLGPMGSVEKFLVLYLSLYVCIDPFLLDVVSDR